MQSQSLYQDLCQTANCAATEANPMMLESYCDENYLAAQTDASRFTASLSVLLSTIAENEQATPQLGRLQLDDYLAKIDAKLSNLLDMILHHPDFKALEATWRGLKFFVDKAQTSSEVKIELLNTSKDELLDDFNDADDLVTSGLHQQLYQNEYDSPGGEPFAAMIADFDFSHQAPDIKLLDAIGQVAQHCHCPFIANASPLFFGKKTAAQILDIPDLTSHFEKASYIQWNNFRQKPYARYIGLTLPKFLLRLPYHPQSQRIKTFQYSESVNAAIADDYLWGNASFAFASNLSRAFVQEGWAVNIRGPQAGGRVDDLLLHYFDEGLGVEFNAPTQMLVPESLECELAKLGFIPFSYYKNSNFACFFSADSVAMAPLYQDEQLQANAKMNTRLPFVFLLSRLAHYLKVLQRENIGTTKNKQYLEDELNQWISTLVTTMTAPPPDIVAKYPLRKGQVTVEENLNHPGFYKINLQVLPHFQIEGVDIELSLVSQMPREQ